MLSSCLKETQEPGLLQGASALQQLQQQQLQKQLLAQQMLLQQQVLPSSAAV